ncbi:MAG: hypothetical protein AAGE98_05460 [Actinomycetota bacterium]
MADSSTAGKYVPIQYVKKLVLSAGADLLAESPVAPPQPIRLADAIKRAGVPRTSAYRAFDIDGLEPQEAFTLELIRLAGGAAISGDDQDRDRGLDYMMTLEDLDAEGMAWAWQEYARLAGADFSKAMTESSGARLLTMALMSERSPELQSALADVEQALGDDPLEGLDVRPMLDLCGLRAVPAVGDENVARAILSVGLSSFMQPQSAIEGNFAELPTGPDGEQQPWTLGGLLLMGLSAVVLEPDPDAEVSADFSVLRFPWGVSGGALPG